MYKDSFWHYEYAINQPALYKHNVELKALLFSALIYLALG